jgi:hypothetical protein
MSVNSQLARNDYIAERRSERAIARRALDARRVGRSENDYYFNIVKFFEGPFCAFSNYRPIELILFEAPIGKRPAFVRHKPARFSVDREIWKLAGIGDPDARDIVAHELGHLDLHGEIVPSNAYQQSFSTDPDRHLRFDDFERSAEWQADTYRDYLLVPDAIAIALDSAKEIAEKCSVPLPLAQRRFGSTRQPIKRRAEAQARGCCEQCGIMIPDAARNPRCTVCVETGKLRKTEI